MTTEIASQIHEELKAAIIDRRAMAARIERGEFTESIPAEFIDRALEGWYQNELRIATEMEYALHQEQHAARDRRAVQR